MRKWSPEFFAQCQELQYKPGVSGQQYKPTEQQYTDSAAGRPLKGIVSYDTMRRWIQSNFKVRPSRLSVDMCAICAKHLHNKRFSKSQAARDRHDDLHLLHLGDADQSYAFRKSDHDAAVDNQTLAVLDCDFAGNFRSPLTNLGPAFYKRICPMNNYIMASSNYVSMYGYDERTAGKGPNEVLSFLQVEIKNLKQLKPDLKHLILWCDGACSQTWNRFFMCFHELVDQTSPLSIAGLLRVDAKRCDTGHSFMWADRCIPPIKRKAIHTSGGIVCAFKSQLNVLRPAKRERNAPRTYEHIIRSCKMGGTNYALHEVRQADVLNFKDFFESKDSIIEAERLKLNFDDGTQFMIKKLCWMSAGQAEDRGTEAKHHGEVWCRTNFAAGQPWKKLPVYRQRRRKSKKYPTLVEAVTKENLAAQRLKERDTALSLLAPVYSALLNLAVEKVADLKEILRLMDGGEEDLAKVYGVLDVGELRAAKQDRRRRKLEKQKRALGELSWSTIVAASAASDASQSGSSSSSSLSSSSSSSDSTSLTEFLINEHTFDDDDDDSHRDAEHSAEQEEPASRTAFAVVPPEYTAESRLRVVLRSGGSVFLSGENLSPGVVVRFVVPHELM